jgi:pimeloyl-ACP methyl ester carboxylesterase
VLIHSGLATGDMMWGERVPALAQYYRVLVPDSRGHGRTNNPAGKLSYGQMADDVAGFIDALGLQRPMILGYSDGAQIALELGLRHPDRVKALGRGGHPEDPIRHPPPHPMPRSYAAASAGSGYRPVSARRSGFVA